MRSRVLTGAFFGVVVLGLTLDSYRSVIFGVGGICLVVVARHFWMRPREERTLVAGIVLVAVAIRIAAVVGVPHVMNLRFGVPFTTASDPVSFHNTAVAFVTDPRDGWIPLRAGRSYLAVLVTLYGTVGPHPGWPRLVNILTSVPLITYGYDLAKTTFDDATAKVTVITFALFPSLILLTVRIGDDVLAVTGSVAAIYYLRRTADQPVCGGIAFAGVTTIVYFLRNQVAYVLIAVATVYVALLVYRSLNRRYEWSPPSATIVATLVATVGFVVIAGVGGDDLLTILTNWAKSNVSGTSDGLATELRASSLTTRILLGPLAVFLMPFPPWEVLLARRQAPAYFLAASSLLLYVSFPYLVFGIRSAVAHRRMHRLPVVLFLGFAVAGITSVYAGTVPRFRTPIAPFILLLTSGGLFRARYEAKWYVAYGVCFTGCVGWYYLLT